MNTLAATKNEHGGVYIAPDTLPDTCDGFAKALLDSLKNWEAEHIKVVWLSIPSDRTELITIAITLGFQFHHCSTSVLTLTKRLKNDAHIPTYATHTIGVGAVVISEQQEILTVLERRDLISRPDYYKLPGGMLEPNEHFSAGVVRETREETGIETEFQGLLSLRHHHRGQFSTSNIYAVCRLKPLTHTIVIDEVEIGNAKWIPVDEYLNHPGVGSYNKRVVMAALASSSLASVKIDGYMDSPEDYEIYLTGNMA